MQNNSTIIKPISLKTLQTCQISCWEWVRVLKWLSKPEKFKIKMISSSFTTEDPSSVKSNSSPELPGLTGPCPKTTSWFINYLETPFYTISGMPAEISLNTLPNWVKPSPQVTATYAMENMISGNVPEPPSFPIYFKLFNESVKTKKCKEDTTSKSKM